MGTKGIVYNIQSYSIHDGPGTRTVVFLKGCPLRCLWCSNPESQDFDREIYYSELKCIGCKTCINVCPQKALCAERSGRIITDHTLCDKCGICTIECPTNAIKLSGDEMTPDQVVARVEKERDYIMNSGGGVTFSGGEPFANAAFVMETAKKLKELGYHIAIETSGHVPYESIEKCLPYIDLFLYDMKAGTEIKHKELTGVSNKLILENMEKVYPQKPLIVRIPIIPGINDLQEEVDAMLKSISKIDKEAEVNLLPYHQLGKPKYAATGREYALVGLEAPSDEYMEALQKKFTEVGLKAKIV